MKHLHILIIGGDTTGVSDRVVNTLLTAMDGVEALEGVRCTTICVS